MIRLWRIVKRKHAAHAVDGEGPWLHGSRWTTRGRRVVYFSESLSLASLEVLVHLHTAAPLAAYVAYSVDLDERRIAEIPSCDLPPAWREYPAPPELQALGDAWLDRGEPLALKVPSAVTPVESNYLLNPLHREFRRLVFRGPQALELDRRLFG